MGILDVFRSGSRNPDPEIRLAAVAKLTDESALVEIAAVDDSARVRLAAVAKIASDERLAEVARDAMAMDARLAAVERISSQELLADIIKTRKNFELMGACFARITDRVVLQNIAEDAGYNPAARRVAVEQFADEAYLDDIAGNGGVKSSGGVEDRGGAEDRGGVKGSGGAKGDDGIEDDGGRLSASTDRKSDAAIEAILTAYGDVRVVRALARFRGSEKALRGLGTIARRGGEVGGLAVEYLCRALKSTNSRLRACAVEELAVLRDPDLVSVIMRGLDTPELMQPLREVLRSIGTPQALAALGEDDGPDDPHGPGGPDNEQEA